MARNKSENEPVGLVCPTCPTTDLDELCWVEDVPAYTPITFKDGAIHRYWEGQDILWECATERGIMCNHCGSKVPVPDGIAFGD